MFPILGYVDLLPPSLRNCPIFIKDARSADSDEKSILWFLFFELWLIVFTIYGDIFEVFKCVTDQKKESPKVVKFTGKMRNELKQMKNQFLWILVFEIRFLILYWNLENCSCSEGGANLNPICLLYPSPGLQP